MGDHGQRGWGILPSPLGSLGRDGRDRQRTGPAGCSQVGRAADYRSRLGEGGKRTGVGTAGGSPRDTWEGLISGGLPQRGDEAREGPGQTPPRPGMPATGSGSPGLEASGQRQKQKARSVPERQGQPPALTGVGAGEGTHRTGKAGRQTGSQSSHVSTARGRAPGGRPPSLWQALKASDQVRVGAAGPQLLPAS